MQGKMASSSRTRTVLPSTLLVVVFVLVFVTACSHAFEISLPVGQVTPTGCAQHRDGVRFAIRKINELNGGKGFAIGFDQTDYVKFTDNTQVVDDTVFTGDDYDTEHQRVLDVLASDAQKHLVVGTCSPKSENEKTIATNRQTVVLALVGPNAYYEDKLDYVFGMHISSYTYTEPSFKSFAFEGAKTVAIAGRKQSLFFQTTCAEGEKYAMSGTGSAQKIKRVLKRKEKKKAKSAKAWDQRKKEEEEGKKERQDRRTRNIQNKIDRRKEVF